MTLQRTPSRQRPRNIVSPLPEHTAQRKLSSELHYSGVSWRGLLSKAIRLGLYTCTICMYILIYIYIWIPSVSESIRYLDHQVLRLAKIHQRLMAPSTVQMGHHINSSPVFIHNRRNRSRRPALGEREKNSTRQLPSLCSFPSVC